jgi:hypothetical protein
MQCHEVTCPCCSLGITREQILFRHSLMFTSWLTCLHAMHSCAAQHHTHAQACYTYSAAVLSQPVLCDVRRFPGACVLYIVQQHTRVQTCCSNSAVPISNAHSSSTVCAPRTAQHHMHHPVMRRMQCLDSECPCWCLDTTRKVVSTHSLN